MSVPQGLNFIVEQARCLFMKIVQDVSLKISMTKQRSKSDLPTKMCPVCNRPFAWRKKWANCWNEVKYCSDRCRRRRNTTEN
jgi:hypothetical protein